MSAQAAKAACIALIAVTSLSNRARAQNCPASHDDLTKALKAAVKPSGGPGNGGLALYDAQGIAGGLGVSGDTSCADHNVAWRVRHALGLDHVPNGVSPAHNDAIIYDMLPDKTSVSGYGHPQCGGSEAEVAEQIHSGVVPQWATVMKK